MSAAIGQSIVMLYIWESVPYFFYVSLSGLDDVKSLEGMAGLKESASCELYLRLLNHHLACYELRILIFK
jgi:hypothetical protein